MPAALREDQHELLSPDGLRSVVFGTIDTGLLTLTRPVISSAGLRENTFDLVNEDGLNFGTEYMSSKTLAFDMGVVTDKTVPSVVDPLRSNLDALDAFEAFWTDERWRRDPWAVAILRTCEGGRVSRCYGRPGKYDEIAGTLTRLGYTPVTCDFRLADSNWYSDTEDSAQVAIIAASQPGLIGPLFDPITSLSVDTSQAVAIVGGSKPTWPIIEFHGQVTNPVLTINGLTIGLTGTVSDGDTVTIDPRPWARTVTKQDGTAVPGMVSTASPPMRKMKLPPGAYPLLFSGTSTTGTGYVKLRWRSARSRP